MLYTRACSEVILADFVHCWLCGAAVTAAGRAMPQTVSNCIRCARLHAGVAIRSVFLCRASGRLTRSAASDQLGKPVLPARRAAVQQLCKKEIHAADFPGAVELNVAFASYILSSSWLEDHRSKQLR